MTIAWNHLCDCCVAALLATEWRLTGRIIQDAPLASACTQLVIQMRDWLDVRQDHFAPIFDMTMADRARNELPTYMDFDEYLDDFDIPMRGRLDVLQLTAASDIMSRRFRILRQESDGVWRAVQFMTSTTPERRHVAESRPVLVVGTGVNPGSPLVELVRVPDDGEDEDTNGDNSSGHGSDDDSDESDASSESGSGDLGNRMLAIISTLPTPARAPNV